jgi:hypothetical protein
MEGELLLTFDFKLELVTPFDFHEYFISHLRTHFTFDPAHLDRLSELSLLLIRMAQ